MEVVEAIIKLNKIFKIKGWSDKDVDEYVFDNFCKLFENFDSNQRKLIVELTERYCWISYTDYQSMIIKALNQIDDKELQSVKKIYFFPVIKVSDENKIKSGHNLIYMIKALKGLLKKYNHIKFEILSKFEQLEEAQLQLVVDERLFLIDDYLGSGETIEECLAEIERNPSLIYNKLKIISIASQKEIHDILNAKGISTHSSFISLKGITDYDLPAEVALKKQAMLEIEKYVPGGSHFSLGYIQSEDLITMMRTPDNTFPIFWKKHRKDGKYFDAPFSREEIFES